MALSSIGLVFLLSTVGKLFGFLRLQAIAFALGPTAETDALIVALTILLAFDVIFVSGSSVVMAQTELIKREERFSPRLASATFARTAGRWTTVAIVFSLACAAFATPLASVVAPGFDEVRRSAFGDLLLAGIAFPPLLTVLQYLSTLNRIRGRDALFASNQIVINGVALIAIIACAASGAERSTISRSMVVATVAGCAIMILVQASFLGRAATGRLMRLVGRRIGPPQSFQRLMTAAESLLVAAPLIIGVLLQQVLVLISLSFASRLGEGVVSIASFGERITGVVLMLSVGTLLTVLEPRWARALVGNDGAARSAVLGDLRLIFLGLLPMTAVLVGCGPELATLLFGHGQFGGQALEELGRVTSAFGLALPGLALSVIFARLLVINATARVIILGSSILVLAHWLACLVLTRALGAIGIPFALALASALQAALFAAVACTRMEEMRTAARHALPRLLGLAAVIAAYTWTTRGWFDANLLDVVVTGLGTTLIAVIGAQAIGLRPIDDLRSLARR